MAKQKGPANPLPVVKIEYTYSDWIAWQKNPTRNERGHAIDIPRVTEMFDAEVLMLNINAGTMRVRIKDHGNHDIDATPFFEQFQITKRQA